MHRIYNTYYIIIPALRNHQSINQSLLSNVSGSFQVYYMCNIYYNVMHIAYFVNITSYTYILQI